MSSSKPPSTTIIPPLLQPYLSLPNERALIILTSVLGAGGNWLLLRALGGILSHQSMSTTSAGTGNGKVVLVSFLRDARFWGEGARRLGVDLDKLAIQKRFAFIDGLSSLYLPSQPPPRNKTPQHGLTANTTILTSPALSKISEEILSAIKGLKSGDDGKVVLIIDGLDLVLAAGGEAVTVGEIEDLVMDVREEVYATIMALSADAPLIDSQQTPLETNHAALVLGTAHQAELIMSLRLLDTGTARDVSGVIRITLGEGAETGDGQQLEEKELLYFVGGDGAVKVFERGQ